MSIFTDADIQQIQGHGLTMDVVNQQLDNFKTGFPFANIESAAVIGHGVRSVPVAEMADFYMQNKDKYNIVKFVPASGAATRMFKDLFEFLASGVMNRTTQDVLNNLDKFAFYDDLMKILPENATPNQIIECLVGKSGLNYGALPKALLRFHKYDDVNRTALEEHLVEGAQYASSNGVVKIHFTISPEHRDGFNACLTDVLPRYQAQFNVKYEISMSEQKKYTDTIAVNMDNTPFRNDDGTLLFRPAGHGALIENLNDIDADIVFIKNIDNVCPDNLRGNTLRYKRGLAGLAMQIQQQIFDFMKDLDAGCADMGAIRQFITKNLGFVVTDKTDVRRVLNRPLRVCGIIKNTGEPGGGPFWVRGGDGSLSLQIVEPGQINPKDISILKDGEFFSPTDLVCMPRDYQGNKFNLTDFVDVNAGFIAEKSKAGRPLRAMERPGLWNGAMAGWNTIFVETPLDTFTPVKVVTDLLKTSHQSK